MTPASYLLMCREKLVFGKWNFEANYSYTYYIDICIEPTKTIEYLLVIFLRGSKKQTIHLSINKTIKKWREMNAFSRDEQCRIIACVAHPTIMSLLLARKCTFSDANQVASLVMYTQATRYLPSKLCVMGRIQSIRITLYAFTESNVNRTKLYYKIHLEKARGTRLVRVECRRIDIRLEYYTAAYIASLLIIFCNKSIIF